MEEKQKTTYEENSEIIDQELQRRRGKWRLTSLAWMDYEDVCQIIRFHIFKKWHQWDPKRALVPWVNKIISNQLKNILRNHYHSFVKPCVSCPFNCSVDNNEDACSLTQSKTQDESCPLFAKWSKSKKHAYGLKLPTSIESLPRAEIECSASLFQDIETSIDKMHKYMGEYLNEKNYEIYKLLFIEKMDEEEVALYLGYKTSEKGRKAGYKQIKNLKAKFKKIAIKIIDKKDIFYQ